ncbi:MAG: hypothetical protein FWD08_05165, partial [Alphaproteobacteria bacterium]|nr:hypothetical protein [Alphaproteobacteria bacterium]
CHKTDRTPIWNEKPAALATHAAGFERLRTRTVYLATSSLILLITLPIHDRQSTSSAIRV